MASSPSPSAEKKRWWVSKRKVVTKYVREAGALAEMREPRSVTAAVALLDAALALSPRHAAALELKARSLLFLRRFREVADMLQDYIPSCNTAAAAAGAVDENSSTSLASGHMEQVRKVPVDGFSCRCFSLGCLKRKLTARFSKRAGDEDHWRYLVLGHACSRLGLMEDAVILLQTSRRLAADARRRRFVCRSGDTFVSYPVDNERGGAAPAPMQSESASQLLSQIKSLLRRTSSAAAALDAGAPAEAVRNFSKVLDSRRGLPAGFAVGCFVGRAAAHRASGRLAEAISDCNRALAVEPSCVRALRARADLFEAVGALPDCLRDLDHLKLLYDAILRDGKLPGPPWRHHHGVRYRDIPTEHRALAGRAQRLRGGLTAAETCGGDVDYHALLGVRRGCTKPELERARLLLMLKHKPEKAAAFVDRLDFADDHRDPESAKDQARMTAAILYRMLQKGYSKIMATLMEEEAAAAMHSPVASQFGSPGATAAERKSCQEQSILGLEAAAFEGMCRRSTAAVGSVVLSGSAITVK